MTPAGENRGNEQGRLPQYGMPFGQQHWLPPAASPQGWEHGLQPQLQPRPLSQSGPPQAHGDAGSHNFESAQFPIYNHDAFDPSLAPQTAQPVQHPAYAWQHDYGQSQFAGGNVDPSLNGGNVHGQGMNFSHGDRFAQSAAIHQTIAPQTLQIQSVQQPASSYSRVQPTAPTPTSTQEFAGRSPATSAPSGVTFNFTMPPGMLDGTFSVISLADLDAVTTSTPLRKYLNVGKEAQEFAKVTKSSALPNPPRRKSRNAIKRLAADNPKLKAKLAKGQPKSKTKPIKTKAPKVPKPKLLTARVGSASAVSTPSSVDNSSDDDSEYDSSDDELDIIEEPPYADKRPSDALEAAAYDASAAVWLPRRKPPTPTQLKKALVDFWEVLSTVRNRWKSDGDALKKAEEAKKQKEIPMLKERVKIQRDILEASISAALKHGHPEVLRLMGGNKPYLQMSYVFLADRLREADVNGSLSRLLLKLLSRATSATTELLEQYKLNKALGMMARKGDDEIKTLAKEIEESGVASSKAQAEKPKEDASPEQKDMGAEVKEATSSATRPPAADAAAGIKRALPGDGSATQPVKRVASSSATAKKPTIGPTKGSPSAGAEKKAVPPTATKPPAPNVAKSAPLYAGLKSASKKPGTAVGDRKPGQITTSADKKAVAPTAPPAISKPTSTFSFKDYMADLSKPKEPEKPKEKVITRAPETDDERRKRERKETRRSLRVQFKEGSALVQVRVFEHDPEEESGHDASMVRDVGDLKSEGQMFKQHFEQMDMDVDDEAEVAPEHSEDTLAFKTPGSVDFNDVELGTRKTTYHRHGGFKLPESKESDVQDEHESNTLLAVYLNKSDIPPNPREPANPYSGDSTIEHKEFGEIPYPVADRAARFAQKPVTSTAIGMASGNSGSSSSLESILASLASHAPAAAAASQPQPYQQHQQQQQQQQEAPRFQPAILAPPEQVLRPVPKSAIPAGFENLFATFEMFRSYNETNGLAPYGPTYANAYLVNPPASTSDSASAPAVAPAVAPAPAPVPVPAPAPAAATSDLSAILASLTGTAPAPPTPVPVATQVDPSFPGFAGPAGGAGPAPVPDLNALMSQFGQTAPQPLMGAAPQFPGFGPAMQLQGPNGGAGFEHPDRKRMFENSGEGDDDYDMANGQGDGKKTKGNPPAGNNGGGGGGGGGGIWVPREREKPKFVLPCRFWKEGRCKRGADCTFLHEGKPGN